MAVGFRTSRLDVQEWQTDREVSDQRAVLVANLRSILTPVVLRDLPPALQLSDKEHAVSDWIDTRDAESTVMLVQNRKTSTLLGLLILAEFTEPDQPTVIHPGYLLGEDAWGQGYATELIGGLVHWYTSNDQPTQFLAGVAKENPASAKVLQKNGFKRLAASSDGPTQMFYLEV